MGNALENWRGIRWRKLRSEILYKLSKNINLSLTITIKSLILI
jgi:hypothetical protein